MANITFGSEYVFNTSTSGYIYTAVIALDDTHFVVAYANSSNYDGYAVIGTVSSGNEIAFGSDYTFDTGAAREISVAKIDATHFVIAYQENASENGYCIIGTVTNGNEITFGSKYEFLGSGRKPIYISVDVLDTTHFILVYKDSDYYSYGRAIIGTISDTNVISYGSEYTFLAGSVYFNSVAKIDATHFVLCYDSTDGQAVIGTVSNGDEIAFGSEYEFTGDPNYISVAVLDTTHFVISYGIYYGGDGKSIIGTISGTTISYGSEYQFNSGISNGDTIYVFNSSLNASSFVISYQDGGNSDYGTAIVGTVSDTNVISYSSEYVFNSAISEYISVSSLDSSDFVVAYQDNGNDNKGTAIIGEYSASSNIVQIITAKSNLLGIRSQTITAKAELLETSIQTGTVKSNIKGVLLQNITTKSDIKNNLSRFIVAKGRILGKTEIKAKASIRKNFSQIINIKSLIKKVSFQNITSKAELLETSNQTIIIKASIKKTISRVVGAGAVVGRTISQTINAKASIKRFLPRIITVKAYIHNPLVPESTFTEEIAKTIRQLAPKIEIQWDGVTWTDESDYFISARGNEQLWKISGEGIAATLDVELDNTTERFTPDNALSPIYQYLKPRTNIRVYITAGGYDYRIFTGYIKNIHPDVRSRICSLECFDNQVLVYNKRANGIVYESKSSDELMTILAGLAELEPEQYDFDIGTHMVNFGYFEDRNVWPIMGEIAVAERGRIFFDREGILTFWNRDRLHNKTARDIIPNITLNDWVTDLDYSVAEHEIKNTIIVQATPRASAGVQVVWTSGNAEYLNPYTDTLVWIPANNVQSAWLELEDPCTTFITPVRDTDFTANSSQDGLGDDLTANIKIHEFINYGNAVFITVLNTGATDAYLTKFQVRGNPAIVLKWIKVTAKEEGSIDLYGRQEFEIENHFVDSEDNAIEIAEEELYRRKDSINLFRADIVGDPNLLCGDVVNIEYRTDNFKEYMVDQLDWTLDERGFRQKLTLVNPYIFPSIQRIDTRANILRHETKSIDAKAKIN